MADKSKAPGQQPDEGENMGEAGKAPKKEKARAAKGKEVDLNTRLTEAEAEAQAAQNQLENTETKMKELEDRLLRTTAEYDNHRKRSLKETEGAFGNGVAHAVLEMLPILDTLETAAACDCNDEEYKKGVLLTLTKFEEVFKKLGVSQIEALGKPFDPELHNAVMQEAADGAEPGTITREVLKGYTLGDRVIRHSMVAVAP